MGPTTVTLGILLLVLAIYCKLDPFTHSPTSGFPHFKSYLVDLPDWSTIPTYNDPLNSLQRSEVMFSGQVLGPESLVFDPNGRGPYTGVADGRVVFWNGQTWVDFAYTSSNRSVCGPQPTPLSYMKNEHICGRPLGLRFHRKTGELYISDAYFGLMKVGPAGGLATSLTTEAEGVPFRFTNDLDVDEDGNVYFTDSSSIFQRRNFMQLVFSGENTGRVLKYDSTTRETRVLIKEIQFPNGVTLSEDASFLIICESALGYLRRYWLKGEKAGTSEIFAVLPGFPDNIRTNQGGEFWVAMHCRRSVLNYLVAKYPRVRDILLKLPITPKYAFLMYVGGFPHGIAAKYSSDGELVKILEDKTGKVVRAVSEVEEHDGKIWIGSVLMDFIAVFDLGGVDGS